jgi:membrane-bound inhibitor of C-type lysozyme
MAYLLSRVHLSACLGDYTGVLCLRIATAISSRADRGCSRRQRKPDPKKQSFRAAKGKRCRILAIGLAVAFGGCVQVVVQEPWDPQGRYVCEDGKSLVVQLRDGGASVAVAYEGGQVTLPQTGGATDGKYSDGRTTLYLDGPRGLLDVGGQILGRGCVKR